MITKPIETSPQFYARIAGVFYLLIIFFGAFNQIFIRDKLVAFGDVAATSNNIMGSELLWRIGVTGDIFMHLLDIPVMVILYFLLKPTSKHLALLAVLFNVIQSAVLSFNKVNLLIPTLLLGAPEYAQSIETGNLHALSYLFVQAHNTGFGIGLIFFGFACLCYGYLIYKSGYFPKTIGVLVQIAGLSYLINSLTFILAPAYAGTVMPILLLSFIGELTLAIWLIVKGVNVPVWKKQTTK